MSHLAIVCGHHQEAIDMVDAAVKGTDRIATPRLRSLLATVKARAHAKAGYAKACGFALNDAERWLDKAKPGTEEPDWIYYFDEADFRGHAATCWVDLKQPTKARSHIDNVLSARDSVYLRDRAKDLVRSAEAYLHANDLEPACDDLRSAAGLVRGTGSIRTIELIRTTRRSMSQHDREPRVQELDQHLVALTV